MLRERESGSPVQARQGRPNASALGVLVVFAALATGAACDALYDSIFKPGSPKETELQRLVKSQANEAELAKVMGEGVRTYRRGTAAWASLEAFFAREPPESLKPVREAMRIDPTIVYHTTAWRMTWVFVDASGIVRGYYQCAQ